MRKEAFCLQQGKLAIRTHLQILTNESIRQTQFALLLNKACITSVFKKGIAQIAINYKPISVTDKLTKVFESLLLTQYMEHNSLLKTYQFRNQENESDTYAVIIFTAMVCRK